MSDKNKRIKVLIADDEPVTRVLLLGMLKDSYHVVSAVDGPDALVKFREERPDILLMDVQMPVLDGCSVCETIRADEGDEHVPILLMSSQAHEDLVLGGLARGADDFVLKPINQRVLLSKIRAALVNKSRSDDIAAQRERLLALQQETAREHFAASAVLRNILDRAELQHPSIRTMLTPMASFDGDVALVSKLPGGNLRIMVCDVVGHGLPAALGTIPIAVLFYSTARQGMELGAAMLEINRQLCDVLPVGLFAAAAAFEVDPDGRTLRLWNGGIPDVILRRRDSSELVRFASENLPIGITPQQAYSVQLAEVNVGDVLFVMSDGVIEARNFQGEIFGIERALSVLRAPRPADELFDELRSELLHFAQGRQDDDITLLAHTIFSAMRQ
jgi:two-component system, HptB-dependent secretion and biofilm response regulator